MLTLYHYCMYCQIRLDTREFSDIRPEKPNIRSIPTCRHHRPRRSISGIAHRCRSPVSRSQTPEIHLVRTRVAPDTELAGYPVSRRIYG